MTASSSELVPAFVSNAFRAVTGAIEVPAGPRDFHRRLPDYEPTRLVRLEAVAHELGLERLFVKDESCRLGLPAFKVLGVSWAVYRALSERCGEEPRDWRSLAELRSVFRRLQPFTLTAATAGNHGRAVARVAAWFGVGARIFVARDMPAGRVAGIRSEGAEVIMIDGSYDDAVGAAADASGEHVLLVADTGAVDDVVTRWICEGYSTMFSEIDGQLADADEPAPDLVVVQIGVGSLALAAVSHYRRSGLASQPTLLGVEPLCAASLLESARAGVPREVSGPHTSIMYALNGRRPSMLGFASVLAGFDAFTAVSDTRVPSAMLALARAGVVSGTAGAAGLVGLYEARRHFAQARRVLLLNTEGLADPSGFVSALAASCADGDAASGVP
jgi:diaminopropionate ammonia-lyase